MTISRRGLFGFLASLPIVGPAIARQPAPVSIKPVSIDPPLMAVGELFEGPYRLSPGIITWVDPDYDERTGEVLRRADARIAEIEEKYMSNQNFDHYWKREV